MNTTLRTLLTACGFAAMVSAAACSTTNAGETTQAANANDHLADAHYETDPSVKDARQERIDGLSSQELHDELVRIARLRSDQRRHGDAAKLRELQEEFDMLMTRFREDVDPRPAEPRILAEAAVLGHLTSAEIERMTDRIQRMDESEVRDTLIRVASHRREIRGTDEQSEAVAQVEFHLLVERMRELHSRANPERD